MVAADTRLSAGHVAALAACGTASLTVRPAPRVVIIAVGSEIQSHGESREHSPAVAEPVADATGPMLSVLFSATGAKVVRVTTVPDDAPALRTAIDDASLQADLVVTIGGLSTEWSDIVGPVLSHAFGVEVRMVRLSPGSRHGLGTDRARRWPTCGASCAPRSPRRRSGRVRLLRCRCSCGTQGRPDVEGRGGRERGVVLALRFCSCRRRRATRVLGFGGGCARRRPFRADAARLGCCRRTVSGPGIDH